MNLPNRRESGFTLIEIMVVVVIIGILATVLTQNLFSRVDQAKITKVHQDIQALEGALDLYKLDNYEYPTTDQGLEALIEKPSSPEPPNWKDGGYVKRLPLDPWDQAYLYLNPGQHGDIDIMSLGPDRQPSEDDIGNWNLK